jgi:hypothetical protein
MKLVLGGLNGEYLLDIVESAAAVTERVDAASLSVNLCAGHNQRQGGVLCQAEPRSWTAP